MSTGLLAHVIHQKLALHQTLALRDRHTVQMPISCLVISALASDLGHSIICQLIKLDVSPQLTSPLNWWFIRLLHYQLLTQGLLIYLAGLSHQGSVQKHRRFICLGVIYRGWCHSACIMRHTHAQQWLANPWVSGQCSVEERNRLV